MGRHSVFAPAGYSNHVQPLENAPKAQFWPLYAVRLTANGRAALANIVRLTQNGPTITREAHMKDKKDTKTAELPDMPKKRGRKPTGTAKTDVERAAEYRSRRNRTGGLRLTLTPADVLMLTDALYGVPEAADFLKRLGEASTKAELVKMGLVSA